MLNNSSSSYLNLLNNCSKSKREEVFSITFMITKFLVVVPLSVLVFCLGYWRWQRTSKMSHSDVFTYNSAALQLHFGLSSIFYISGYYTGLSGILLLGVYAGSIVFPGEIALHVLTSVDHYLAVVHPISYQWLKQSGGIRVRNVSISCVWLFCFGWVGVVAHIYPDIPYIAYLCLLISSLISISFCSFSVLCALIHSGPGKLDKKKERANKSKRKAFLTILAILGALLVYFVAVIMAVSMETSNLLSHENECLILISAQYFGVPCSLVLPLLFLRRVKKR